MFFKSLGIAPHGIDDAGQQGVVLLAQDHVPKPLAHIIASYWTDDVRRKLRHTHIRLHLYYNEHLQYANIRQALTRVYAHSERRQIIRVAVGINSGSPVVYVEYSDRVCGFLPHFVDEGWLMKNAPHVLPQIPGADRHGLVWIAES